MLFEPPQLLKEMTFLAAFRCVREGPPNAQINAEKTAAAAQRDNFLKAERLHQRRIELLQAALQEQVLEEGARSPVRGARGGVLADLLNLLPFGPGTQGFAGRDAGMPLGTLCWAFPRSHVDAATRRALEIQRARSAGVLIARPPVRRKFSIRPHATCPSSPGELGLPCYKLSQYRARRRLILVCPTRLILVRPTRLLRERQVMRRTPAWVRPNGRQGWGVRLGARRVWGRGHSLFKYWFAQRVWEVRVFFKVLICPTGLGVFWRSTASPNGSGGRLDFFKYWFAQRVWAVSFFFKYWSA